MKPVFLNRFQALGMALTCAGLIAGCGDVQYDAAIVVVEEEAVMVEPAPAAPERHRVTKSATPTPRAGVVTAGDIDDALNLAAFGRYQARAGKALNLPRMDMRGAVMVQVVQPDGMPAPGVSFNLRKPGESEPFYSGYSGVDGRIFVLPAALGHGALPRVELRAFGEGQTVHETTVKTGTGRKITLPVNGNWEPDFLDLVFVFDTTGSMGDELDWLTREFASIVRTARRAAPGVDIRYGLVAYRDDGDLYKVRNFGFTSRQGQMQRWLRSLDASGGGDYPEAAADAMQAAANLKWRRGKGERLVFHVADAPPHAHQARQYFAASRALAGKDVQIFGLGASGVGEESEFLMRQAALVSGGRYLFLTDDSGVGYAHAEPKIACYRVTSLKSLLVRVLSSELSGRRHEARTGEIIREVGNYRQGVCLQ